MKAPNFWNLIARARTGMAEPWGWISIQAIGGPPGGPGTHTLLKGAMPGPPFKSGPRKGRTNWAKRDRSFDRTVVISNEDFDAFKRNWELETGLCCECGGDGDWCGVKCPRCCGSGRPQP